STSRVGFPRESRISRAMTASMRVLMDGLQRRVVLRLLLGFDTLS
ncbi:MAG: hypothetical protein ACI9MR_004589, partial [Myxococcota bacterium]